MKIAITNAQRLHRVNPRAVRDLTSFLMSRAAEIVPALRAGTISVVLTDDRGISIVNRAHLGHAGATDVISFRYARMPGDAGGVSGEILVNVQRAVTVARRWSAARELALYIAHGCDHLTGADDNSPAARRRMRRRELGWLRAAGRARTGIIEQLLNCQRHDESVLLPPV